MMEVEMKWLAGVDQSRGDAQVRVSEWTSEEDERLVRRL